ncbi:peptide-methionine (S)-S-oxide reductase MsrA [Gammaproteobacteria bacterium]|nr:peptide-methionine (S)-S-oxide reductase MsrA [Gammaproteobacteria bacterium]
MVTGDIGTLFKDSFGLERNNLVTENSVFVSDLDDIEYVIFAMGCFWGAERLFWKQTGVVSTAVGYIGGKHDNPSYEEVCFGNTGHAEGVLVVFDPRVKSLDALLKVFWESHDPTQGMRQGNDIGSQYRSLIVCNSKTQASTCIKSMHDYQIQLSRNGFDEITTEIISGSTFYYAEGYHQQYLQKNPNGYCGLRGTGIYCQS